MQNMDLLQGSISVLEDSKFYLENLTDAEYTQQIQLMSNATIGQHTRHFIEFYQCLMGQAITQKVNYCKRARDLEIEAKSSSASVAIDKIISQLSILDLGASVLFYTSKDGTEYIESTIARELHFNIEHCIHHLALIKIGLKILRPDITLPDSFGVASSTIQYRKTLAS